MKNYEVYRTISKVSTREGFYKLIGKENAKLYDKFLWASLCPLSNIPYNDEGQALQYETGFIEGFKFAIKYLRENAE